MLQQNRGIKMTYGYIRVSTEKQTVENQKLAILDYCKKNGIDYIEWCAETRSGTIDYKKRFLGKLTETLQEGDTLIVTEISRLGRSITMIFDFMQRMIQTGVTVVALKNNFTLTRDDITAKVLLFAFGLSAEIERNLISERTKLGLERARNAGKHLGRMKGKPGPRKLDGKTKLIRQYLREGRSKLSISREFNVSSTTLYTYMQLKHIKY